MIPVRGFEGRKVAVFGLGRTGLTAARALMAGGAEVALWDDGAKGREAALAEGLPLTDISGADWSQFAALMLSPGVPLTLTINLTNVNAGCAALAEYAIYIWQADADGRYSIYDLPQQNYLRGVQATNAAGQATFTTIVPGCYEGRYPHIHFEVYRSLATATAYANRLLVSQFALPADVCNAVYATSGYPTPARACRATESSETTPPPRTRP